MHTFLNFDYFPLKKDSLLISPLDFKIRSFEFLKTPKKEPVEKKLPYCFSLFLFI